MEGTGLFNPGFIGGQFLWWIGQVMDSKTWQDNQTGKVVKDPATDIPGWGYRYKVRIMGIHDKSEAVIASDQLPWAQVMYGVSDGGGQGGNYATPSIRQGNFVFGFFLDGQEQQVPVIMGVLGNNAKTVVKDLKTGTTKGENFTAQSAYTNDGTTKTSDSDQPTEEPKTTPDIGDYKKLNTSRGAKYQTWNGSSWTGRSSARPRTGKEWKGDVKSFVPSKESTDSPNQKTAADTKEERVLDKKHALACADPENESDMKNINVAMGNLNEKIENLEKSVVNYEGGVSLPKKEIKKNIDEEMDKTASEVAQPMSGIMGRVQSYVTKDYNDKLAPILRNADPSESLDLMKKNVDGLEKLACVFNKIRGNLAQLIGAALRDSLNNKKKQSPPPTVGQQQLDTPGANDVPPLPPEGTYVSNPVCSTEELIGNILGNTLNDITQTYTAAIKPIVVSVDDPTLSGSEGQDIFEKAVNQENVIAALESGSLVGGLSAALVNAIGIDPSTAGQVTTAFNSGNYAAGLAALANLSGNNMGEGANVLSRAVQSIDNGDIMGAFSSLSDTLGIDPALMMGVGGAFAAINSGNLSSLTGIMTNLGGMNGGILNSVLGGKLPIVGGLPGLGALGAPSFDIALATTFVTGVAAFFECDPKFKCPANDTHTLRNGGSGTSEKDTPNSANVSNAAANSKKLIPKPKPKINIPKGSGGNFL